MLTTNVCVILFRLWQRSLTERPYGLNEAYSAQIELMVNKARALCCILFWYLFLWRLFVCCVVYVLI